MGNDSSYRKMKAYNLMTGEAQGWVGTGGDQYVELVAEDSAAGVKWENKGEDLYLAKDTNPQDRWMGEGGGAWKGYADWGIGGGYYCAVLWNADHTVSMKSDPGRKLYKYHSFSKDWLCWSENGDNNQAIVRLEWE